MFEDHVLPLKRFFGISFSVCAFNASSSALWSLSFLLVFICLSCVEKVGIITFFALNLYLPFHWKSFRFIRFNKTQHKTYIYIWKEDEWLTGWLVGWMDGAESKGQTFFEGFLCILR